MAFLTRIILSILIQMLRSRQLVCDRYPPPTRSTPLFSGGLGGRSQTNWPLATYPRGGTGETPVLRETRTPIPYSLFPIPQFPSYCSVEPKLGSSTAASDRRFLAEAWG